MNREDMRIGARYNWRNQPERLIYLGKKGCWHQFELVTWPGNVWCEILDYDLKSIEETQQEAQKNPQTKESA